MPAIDPRRRTTQAKECPPNYTTVGRFPSSGALKRPIAPLGAPYSGLHLPLPVGPVQPGLAEKRAEQEATVRARTMAASAADWVPDKRSLF